jgi:hypothetical protein
MATLIYSHHTAQHSSVEQYASMFHMERKQVLNELNKLPELANQHRLKMKIMFTVVVVRVEEISEHSCFQLSYRSVVDQVDAHESSVFRALRVNEHEQTVFDDQLTAIRRSVHTFLQARALAQHAMDNAKVVTGYFACSNPRASMRIAASDRTNLAHPLRLSIFEDMHTFQSFHPRLCQLYLATVCGRTGGRRRRQQHFKQARI